MNKEILEGNKLIAEFMTEEPEVLKRDLKRAGTLESMQYHKSWDLLMPCIGKISNECEEPEELDGLKYALLSDDIETAWEFIVDRLKFYTNDNARINH